MRIIASCISLFSTVTLAEDPTVSYEFELSYITASPLGVPQQVIAINGKFPGPTINSTTNYNVVVNVRNKLDEDLLLTWAGIQQKRSSWQDGRVLGGFGSFIINPRSVIPIPFDNPAGDITILIGDRVLINGKGPYRYNKTLVPDGIDHETINVKPAETEGSYTVQQNYTSLDIHVGQSYSVLVTMDQNASSDYYIVASARWNVSSSGARPNPQGSFKYGSINVTEVFILKNKPWVKINGKRRATLSGISFVTPTTPIRLADEFKVKGAYKLDFPSEPLTGRSRMETSVMNATYKGFMEVILQNNETKMHSYHMDGYAFFVVGMGYGEWTNDSRGTYNKWDGIARSTTQVYPGAWTSILISLDNVGVWNLRTENLDSWPQDISSEASAKFTVYGTMVVAIVLMMISSNL
ncbi:monocopper oxidase-like protein SKU5 [Tanacetum coccineum]